MEATRIRFSVTVQFDTFVDLTSAELKKIKELENGSVSISSHPSIHRKFIDAASNPNGFDHVDHESDIEEIDIDITH